MTLKRRHVKKAKGKRKTVSKRITVSKCITGSKRKTVSKRITGGKKEKNVVVKSFPECKENLEEEIKKCDMSAIKFYMDRCPHCVVIKSMWEEVGNELKEEHKDKDKSKKIGIYEVEVERYGDIHDKYGANQGVPHIILVNKGGEVIKTFNEERTKENLKSFIRGAKAPPTTPQIRIRGA